MAKKLQSKNDFPMTKKNSFYLIFYFVSTILAAQEGQLSFDKKKVTATRISSTIKVDGVLDELEWKNAEIAKNFFGFDPENGNPEPDTLQTEIKVLYDDNALYIGALLHDNQPDKILKEITERDNFGTADLFGVFINGFNDGQQEYSFFVNAANGQADCIRTSQEGEDFTWDAIWHSEAKITNKGWVVELKIPYAAIRFSKLENQIWGINFFREVRRLRYKYTWNKVNNRVGTFTQQAGLLEGIKNIQTPTRLFLIPYSSFYLNSPSQEKAEGTLKGGLDLKYGLSDAFTLDAVLIPDFGQTKFDNKILNLGPFEQVFNENRPFFTEGTDLFNKGNLFYSRRIGGAPSSMPTYDASQETIVLLPTSIKLVNALKISGRTKKGLGVGILNAITDKTEAIIQNNNTGTQRNELVEPLANYNIAVFDQRFNQNSSVSFINTNVTRSGVYRDANVSAIVFNLNTKKNTYNASGAVKYSYVNEFADLTNKKGQVAEIYLSETTGKFRFSMGGNYVSKYFDSNDLGINFQTNYYALSGNINYRILKATTKFNAFRVGLGWFSQFHNDTNNLQEQNVNINVNITNKKNHSYGFNAYARLFNVYDYYDSRIEGRYTLFPKFFNWSTYLSTNYNNKFAIDVNPWIGFAATKGWWFTGYNISPRYRFSNKFMLVINHSLNLEYNDLGWIDYYLDDAVYARRNKKTIETGLEGKYSISSKMNFKLNVRHYWSYAENISTHLLQKDGTTIPFEYLTNKNSNLNLWNFDLSYSWWFAPGSQITVLYRNNSSQFKREIDDGLAKVFTNALNKNVLNHAFSISFRYFIDYNQTKHFLK